MRSTADRKIAGVCGGIAEYFDIDSTLVRVIWVLAVLVPPLFLPAFLGYFLAWLVMPKPPASPVYAPPVSVPHSTQTT